MKFFLFQQIGLWADEIKTRLEIIGLSFIVTPFGKRKVAREIVEELQST